MQALVGGVLLMGLLALLGMLLFFGVRLGRYAWRSADHDFDKNRRITNEKENGRNE